MTPSMMLHAALPGLSDANEITRRACRAGAQPDPKLRISEWADKYRVLTTRSSPEPGLWRTDRTPFLRDIMDALMPALSDAKFHGLVRSDVNLKQAAEWLARVVHSMAVNPGITFNEKELSSLASFLKSFAISGLD